MVRRSIEERGDEIWLIYVDLNYEKIGKTFKRHFNN